MEELIKLGRRLWQNPEPGFFERETHLILSRAFESAGFKIRPFRDIPGFTATVDGKEDGKSIALVADMDALPLPAQGGFSHSCGHHMQMTALYGAAVLLKERGEELLPEISFMAIPGEEFIDLKRRETLRISGRISKLSGKQELIARGLFKNIKAVVATHAAGLDNLKSVSSVLTMNGFEVMSFTFKGSAAHAGAHPYLGINAQNAASLFLQSCAFLREGFQEDKHIRIHPVVKLKENQPVNIIPDYAGVETYVRAVDVDTIEKVAGRLSEAAEGCARALGAEVTVKRSNGYAPFKADLKLHEQAGKIAAKLGLEFVEEDFSAASTDMGDVSRIKPSVIIGFPGSNGLFHNPDFRIIDEEAAYVLPAEFLFSYIRDLVI